MLLYGTFCVLVRGGDIAFIAKFSASFFIALATVVALQFRNERMNEYGAELSGMRLTSN